MKPRALSVLGGLLLLLFTYAAVDLVRVYWSE